MATTTNYSWTTPDDTGLVKDGASAIRTLGSAIDTTTKNLNPSTTLGDIEYRSSTANTNTRLAIGSTGQVLTVSGGVPAWATASSGGMTLINTGGTTLSGASVTVSSIPSSYNDLHILVINFRPVTDDDILTYYFNGDNGSKYQRPGSALYNTNQIFNDNYLVAATNQDNGATSNQKSSIQITGYAQSTWKTAVATHISNNATTNTNSNLQFTISATNITAAISSITFAAAGGNMTSGTVYVYGVK